MLLFDDERIDDSDAVAVADNTGDDDVDSSTDALCYVVDMMAANMSSQRQHLDHHVCTICSKRFARSRTLHMLAHSGANRCGKNRVMPNDTRQTYNCRKCAFKTLVRTSLIRHNRLMHANVAANSDTSRHRKQHNARHKFECNKCHFKTRFSTSLTRHNHLMHGNKTSFTDDTCDSKHLEKPIEVDQTFDCSNCEFTTASHNLLTEHYRLVHGLQANQQHVSSLNKLNSNHKDKNRNLFDALESVAITVDATENEEAMDKEQMDNDQLQSNNLLSFVKSTICSTNDNTDKETSQLVKRGMRASEHVCNVCGKRCKYARSLALHMKAHSGLKNQVSSSKEVDYTSTFSCSRCSFVTSYKSSILRHVNVMHRISNPQSTDEAVSPGNHGNSEGDGGGSRQVLNDVQDDERNGFSVVEDSSGQQNPTTMHGAHRSQFNDANTEDDEGESQRVLKDDRDDKRLSVVEKSNVEEIPRTTHGENSSHCNHSDDGDDANDDDNDNFGRAEVDVTTAAPSCVADDSGTGVEPEQTVHNDVSVKDSHSDRVVDKPAGLECPICGKHFARSLRLHMLAHTGMNSVTPDNTRKTYKCSKCPFKTVFYGWLTRHDRVIHQKMIANGNVSHHSKCYNNGANAVQVFKCNKCQFKTPLSTSLTRHNRLKHKPDKHHDVKDNKQQSESQSECKLLNEDSVNSTELDSCDQVNDTNAVKDSSEQRDCSREDKQSSHRKKRKCKDDSQVEQVKQPLLQLGDMKVCERKKYACSECGLMMMRQSDMIRHCSFVHGAGLSIHVKRHEPAPAVGSSGTAADSVLYFPQEKNGVQLPSSLPSTASDANMPSSGCTSQMMSNLCSATAVEMSAVVTDKSNAVTSVDNGCKYVYSTNDGSVSEAAFQSHHSTGSASVQHPQHNSVEVIDTTSLQCPTCVKTFPSIDELHKHFENSSASKCGKAYLCQFCGKCFVTSYYLTFHTKQHFGTKLYQCEVCGRDFTSFAILKRHWSLHDGTNPNTCHVCGQQYSSSVVLKRHMKKCRKTRQQKHPPGNVVREPSEKVAKLLTCHVCRKTTDSLAKMHEHKLTHHSDHCNSLQAKAASQSSVKFDSAMLFQHKSSVCTICGKTFAKANLLRRHVTAVHSGIIAAEQHNSSTTDEKRFQCPKCNKVFSEPGRHTSCLGNKGRQIQGKQSQGRRFHCEECNRSFASRQALNAHERRHAGTDERRFLCKFCGDRFYQFISLQNHTRLHTGEKPHCCETCGRRFGEVSSFRNHMRLHTGERPFLCSECAKGFVTSSALKEHIIVMHTDHKDFECPVCGWKFALRKAMRRHVKDRHGTQFLDN